MIYNFFKFNYLLVTLALCNQPVELWDHEKAVYFNRQWDWITFAFQQINNIDHIAEIKNWNRNNLHLK